MACFYSAQLAWNPTAVDKIEGELHRIADMRMEISEQLTAVGEAMRGDSSYWTVGG